MDQKDNTVLGGGGDSCLKQCTRIFLPVCGSDGATYNNLCLLEIADCESKAKGGPGVTLVSESACGECVGVALRGSLSAGQGTVVGG